MGIYVYTNTFMHVTTVNKKTSNLKESKKKYMGYMEGGKGREKCSYYTISSKGKKRRKLILGLKTLRN